ncbi:MAG: hypothetical protein V1782_13095 [Pseudomonadota bacterium]
MGYQIPLACAAVVWGYRTMCARAGRRRILFIQLIDINTFIKTNSKQGALPPVLFCKVGDKKEGHRPEWGGEEKEFSLHLCLETENHLLEMKLFCKLHMLPHRPKYNIFILNFSKL